MITNGTPSPLTTYRESGDTLETDLTLRVVTEEDEFADLESDWNQLADRCPDSDFFSDWTWLYYWWRSYGDDSDLRIFVVRDRLGTLRGVLPCYLRETRRFRFLRYLELRFLGTGRDHTPTYGDLLAAPRDRASVTRLTIPHLLGESAAWDVLSLDDMPVESPLTRILPREMSGYKFVSERFPIGLIELPPTWDDYLCTLEPEARDLIDSAQGSFFQLSGARHFVWKNREKLREVIDSLQHLHGLRRRTGSSAGSQFQQTLMEQLFERDQLRCHCLEAGGEIIAIAVCYAWHRTIYAYESVCDPRFADGNPETILISCAIRSAIEEGASRFDMLKGSFNFTASLSTQKRETVSLGAYRDSRIGSTVRFINKHRSRRKNPSSVIES